jgi:hypothetical protein
MLKVTLNTKNHQSSSTPSEAQIIANSLGSRLLSVENMKNLSNISIRTAL